MTNTVLSADELLREAHAAAYRFPVGFAGFRAGLRLPDGSPGQVTVRSPEEIEVVADPAAAALSWVRSELASLVAHRWPADYDDGDGRWTKRVDDDEHPLGVRIVLNGDPYHSAYRVRDGHIAEVDRVMGRTRFSIVIDSRAAAVDGRTLPERFHIAYWSAADQRLLRVETFHHEYVQVAGVHLPGAVRLVIADDAGLAVRQLVLTDHEVLTDAA